jgi:hypothetical protein
MAVIEIVHAHGRDARVMVIARHARTIIIAQGRELPAKS